MKVSQRKNDQKDFFEMLPQAIAKLRKNIIEPFIEADPNSKYANERPPMRSELFTEEQMDQHAKSLARRHLLISEHPSEHLLKRLAENEKMLLEVHALLTEAVKENDRYRSGRRMAAG